MWNKTKILNYLKVLSLTSLLFLAIGFTEKKQNQRVCQEIIIAIDGYYDHYFLNQEDVMFLITEGGQHQVLGVSLTDMEMKEIEARIRTHKFVDDVQVFRDLKGNLMTKVKQRRPIARIVQEEGYHAYVDEGGKILPISDRFTARVMLLGGDYQKELLKKDLTETYRGREVMDMLQYIHNDPFWRAQIAQMDIDLQGNVTLYPQVGKQYVEFGKAEDLDKKFNKLRIFYKQILPSKGWNKYRKVNLKYKNQIICE